MIMLSNTTNLSATSLTIQRSTRLFTRGIFGIVNNFVAAIVAERERQANLIILRSLSDRDLKDIGLCRNQIGGDLTEAARERARFQNLDRKRHMTPSPMSRGG